MPAEVLAFTWRAVKGSEHDQTGGFRETCREQLVGVRGHRASNGKEETYRREISEEDLGRTADSFKMGSQIKEDFKRIAMCQSWGAPTLILHPSLTGRGAQREDTIFSERMRVECK